MADGIIRNRKSGKIRISERSVSSALPSLATRPAIAVAAQMLVLAFHLLALGQLTTCPSCGACSSGSGTYIMLDGYAGEYYYLTSSLVTCSACSSVVSGGAMYIYQAYDGTGLLANVWNKYLWFDCTNGKWTRSVVPDRGYGPCRDPFSCSGPYPAGTTMATTWSTCPYGGAPKCPAPSPPPPPDFNDLIRWLIIGGVALLVFSAVASAWVYWFRPCCNAGAGPNSRGGLEMAEVTVRGYA